MSLKGLLQRSSGKHAANGGGSKLKVVIAGGGIAALEAALALRELASGQVSVTLVYPEVDFVYRPAAVAEPFVDRPPRVLSLQKFADDVGASLVRGRVASVDPGSQVFVTADRTEVPYDAAILAVGASLREPSPHALTINPSKMRESLRPLIDEIRAGTVKSIAFVATSPTWPLPVYEIALFARQLARESGSAPEITILTDEPEPLAVFGSQASAGVSRVLAAAEIETRVGAIPEIGEGEVRFGSETRSFDRIVAAPQLSGPDIDGLPADEHGFVPIDDHARVVGLENLYVVGDAANFPVKQGGLASQQADAAAESIAAHAGASITPNPFSTNIHGMLWTNAPRANSPKPLYLSARIEEGVPWVSRISEEPTWEPEQVKVAARYLANYLDDSWVRALRGMPTLADLAPGESRAHAS